MAKIRSSNTKPELALRRALRDQELLGYRIGHRRLPGKPDVAFTRWKVAVFVDGAFWHGHPDHYEFGRPGRRAYWDPKIRRTQERDAAANEALGAAGWTVLRFWDFDVLQDPVRSAKTVQQAISDARAERSRGT